VSDEKETLEKSKGSAPCEKCWDVAGAAVEYFINEFVENQEDWDSEARGEAVTAIMEKAGLDPRTPFRWLS
jgi:hypothetical protein